jgi:hypothetical protein
LATNKNIENKIMGRRRKDLEPFFFLTLETAAEEEI